MDKEVAAEVGKIAALVARLGNSWEFDIYKGKLLLIEHVAGSEWNELTTINITKTARAKRIPALRRLADRLRAELKEQKK